MKLLFGEAINGRVRCCFRTEGDENIRFSARRVWSSLKGEEERGEFGIRKISGKKRISELYRCWLTGFLTFFAFLFNDN